MFVTLSVTNLWYTPQLISNGRREGGHFRATCNLQIVCVKLATARHYHRPLKGNQWLPINKKLWTSSFTLFMAGLDFVAFAICLWLVDELGWKRITEPFVILGRNAIAIYMVSELLAETLSSLHWQKPLYQALFASWASPIDASLLWAISYTLLMFLVAWFMNRRGWFLRV